MVSFSIDYTVLKTIHALATSPALDLRDISLRFEKKIMKCRLRTQQGFVAFSYVSKCETDINIDELFKVTFDSGDISSILKMSKDESKIGFTVIDGRAVVVAGNSKKKIPIIEHEIWMERFPNPEITQSFTMTYEQIRTVISAFDVKSEADCARVAFNTDSVMFVNFDNQRQTETIFKKEEFGRANLSKNSKVSFCSKSLMQILSTIPKDANVEIAIDTNMPFSITFDVEAGRFKILQAPYIEDD